MNRPNSDGDDDKREETRKNNDQKKIENKKVWVIHMKIEI